MKKIINFSSFIKEGLWSSAKNNMTLENPPGSNKGSEVERMQANVGASPGDPWCAAYVYTVFKDAGLPKEIMDRIPKNPGVKNSWGALKSKKGVKIITADEARKNPALVKPGMVFYYLTKNPKTGTYPGEGHTGIILQSFPSGRYWNSLEGNTNPADGSREGIGTFVIRRELDDPSISKDPKNKPAKLLGFADFFDGYRSQESVKKFLDDAERMSVGKEYVLFTKKEIEKIKKNPKVLDQYGENYNNRNKR